MQQGVSMVLLRKCKGIITHIISLTTRTPRGVTRALRQFVTRERKDVAKKKRCMSRDWPWLTDNGKQSRSGERQAAQGNSWKKTRLTSVRPTGMQTVREAVGQILRWQRKNMTVVRKNKFRQMGDRQSNKQRNYQADGQTGWQTNRWTGRRTNRLTKRTKWIQNPCSIRPRSTYMQSSDHLLGFNCVPAGKNTHTHTLLSITWHKFSFKASPFDQTLSRVCVCPRTSARSCQEKSVCVYSMRARVW